MLLMGVPDTMSSRANYRCIKQITYSSLDIDSIRRLYGRMCSRFRRGIARHMGFMLLSAITLAAIPTSAQTSTHHTGPIVHIGHYVRTHKELLAADAIVAAGVWAEMASSIHCEDVSPRCLDKGPLGPRPGHDEFIAVGFIESGVTITGYHLLWHYAPRSHPIIRHLIWIPTTYVAISEAYTIKNNVDTAERLQNARQRLMNGG